MDLNLAYSFRSQRSVFHYAQIDLPARTFIRTNSHFNRLLGQKAFFDALRLVPTKIVLSLL